MLGSLKRQIKKNKWLYAFLANHKQHQTIHQKIESIIAKTTPQAFLHNLDIDITAHCNLNCYSCDHFSQLADSEVYDLEQYQKDMAQLSTLTQGMIQKIQIIGGEPLLNKQCKEYCAIARTYFPQSRICIITNAILLLKQEEAFWESCRDNRIEITPTKYPIRIDWEAIKQKCEQYNVVFDFFNQAPEKYSYKTCLNPEGNLDPTQSFISCHRANHCTQLKDSRIYPCSITASIKYFNKHFKQNLQTSSIVLSKKCCYANHTTKSMLKSVGGLSLLPSF